MKCDLCNRPAVTFVRYNGTHLCGDHLMRYVEKRVKCEIRKQADLLRGGTIAVARTVWSRSTSSRRPSV